MIRQFQETKGRGVYKGYPMHPTSCQKSPTVEVFAGGHFLLLFEGLFPCYLTIDNAFIPNEKFHLVVMTLFLLKHFIIPFNANGPKSNAMEKVPTFQPNFVFLMDVMAEDAIFPWNG